MDGNVFFVQYADYGSVVDKGARLGGIGIMDNGGILKNNTNSRVEMSPDKKTIRMGGGKVLIMYYQSDQGIRYGPLPRSAGAGRVTSKDEIIGFTLVNLLTTLACQTLGFRRSIFHGVYVSDRAN